MAENSDQILKSKIEEEKIIDFLEKLGFSKVFSNKTIKDGKKEIGEIDAAFTYKDYLFIVEVSTKKKLDNQKKNFFFSKWSDGYNLRILRKKFNLKTKKTIRIYFDRVTKEPQNHEGLDHITKRRKGNKIVYLDKYDEFYGELFKNHSSARKKFLEWLEKPEK